jgi:hypothetical protein
MAIEASGKLYRIFETKQITERFTKREFVIELEDGKYPQHVLFQLTGDRCGNLDDYKEGDEVRVEFNLRGREWTSPKGDVKFFNSLDVWRMEPVGARVGNEPPPPSEPPPDMDADIPF